MTLIHVLHERYTIEIQRVMFANIAQKKNIIASPRNITLKFMCRT